MPSREVMNSEAVIRPTLCCVARVNLVTTKPSTYINDNASQPQAHTYPYPHAKVKQNPSYMHSNKNKIYRAFGVQDMADQLRFDFDRSIQFSKSWVFSFIMFEIGTLIQVKEILNHLSRLMLTENRFYTPNDVLPRERLANWSREGSNYPPQALLNKFAFVPLFSIRCMALDLTSGVHNPIFCLCLLHFWKKIIDNLCWSVSCYMQVDSLDLWGRRLTMQDPSALSLSPSLSLSLYVSVHRLLLLGICQGVQPAATSRKLQGMKKRGRISEQD